ncbi:MAG: hypothetical protein HC849_15310 [Oscillatoriales cyanobacterium RU_3_3]|nr:hypothetical protein [Oscillatoriales cyanobacterium RU_3_3]
MLIVFNFVGVISPIALPSYLNRTSQAKHSESIQYVGSISPDRGFDTEGDRDAINVSGCLVFLIVMTAKELWQNGDRDEL